MTEKETSRLDQGLRVEVVTKPDEDIKANIERTVLGVPGGMLYKIVDPTKRLHELTRPFFMCLRKSGRLLGTACLAHRMVQNISDIQNSFYIRYFSIFAPIRATSKKKEKKAVADLKKFDRPSPIKDLIKNFFDSIPDLNHPDYPDEKAAISYAYVDPENYRSMDFSGSLGFESIRKIHTMLFSRFFPKVNPNVYQIQPDEKEKVLGFIKEKYSDFTFFFTNHCFYNEQYYVYKKDGEIVAGLHADPVDWEFVEMPGIDGWLINKVVPHLPYLSRVYPPDMFRFIALEAVWYKPGHQKYLIPIIETVLKNMERYTALLWLDQNSLICKELRSLGKGGFMRSFKKTTMIDLRTRFYNLSKEAIQKFHTHPAYISAHDLT